MRYLYVAATSVFLVIAITVALLVPVRLADANKGSQFYVGVSFCGNTEAEAKLLIDRVKPYTNLFVLQSFPISRNETAINKILEYAVSQGLFIIVNLSTYNQTYWSTELRIFENARQRWGDKFLGAYYSDEPGGFQIDYNWSIFFEPLRNYFENPKNQPNSTELPTLYQMYLKIRAFEVNGTKPKDYNLEAKIFLEYFNQVENVNNVFLDKGFIDLKEAGFKLYVSDYALYWFDFLAGYDVVLTQFGSNSSITQNIDLIRGAAKMQNKDWGAIITWKYDHSPYLDTGDEIYRQMLSAYQAGAKYVILFDYPYNGTNPYGVLQDEHFYALEKFSNDVRAMSNMRTISEGKADAVLVLPQNYGWGMRKQDDTIWGFWGPDSKSPQIWDISRKLLAQYGLYLDIVYDDPAFPVQGKYEHIYFWNQAYAT